MAAEPGLGSAVYWQVAQVASPSLVEGLRLLAQGSAALAEVPTDRRAQAEVDLTEEFLVIVPDPAKEFQKVDLALLAIAAGGGAAAHSIAAPLGAPIAAALAVVATGLELAGLVDVVPDDGGLKALVTRLKARAAAHRAANRGANQIDVPDAAHIGELERQIEELALAEVEFERLKCHLTRNVNRYGSVIWSQYSSAEIGGLISRYSFPPHLLELDFAGFIEDKGVLRVLDTTALPSVGFNWGATEAKLKLGDDDPGGDIIVLPTPGVVVEPSLGQCSACEDWAEDKHQAELALRREDVRMSSARAKYQELECDRLAARIDAGQLEDPSPRE